jgi:hypothetical protein
LVGNYEGKRLLEDIGIDERIILKWPRKNRIIMCGFNLFDSESGKMAGSRKHGNEHSDSMKGGESVNKMSTYPLLKTTLFHGDSFSSFDGGQT